MAVTTTNIRIEPCNVSWGGDDLGAIDGDIEVSFREDTKEIVAHQTGTNILDEIRTGKGIEAITITFKETSVDNLSTLFSAASSGFTPEDGTAVIGWGTDKDFSSLLEDADKLVIHPVAAASDDYSRDMAFWKAYPVPGSLTKSGENEDLVSVTFKIFPDRTLEPEVQYFVLGDHTQTFTAS